MIKKLQRRRNKKNSKLARYENSNPYQEEEEVDRILVEMENALRAVNPVTVKPSVHRKTEENTTVRTNGRGKMLSTDLNSRKE